MRTNVNVLSLYSRPPSRGAQSLIPGRISGRGSWNVHEILTLSTNKASLDNSLKTSKKANK